MSCVCTHATRCLLWSRIRPLNMKLSWHGNVFHITGTLWEETISHCCIPLKTVDDTSSFGVSLLLVWISCCTETPQHSCNITIMYQWISEALQMQTKSWFRPPAENFYMLTHWGHDKMAAIFVTIFLNAFSWMKIHEFRLIFHRSLFLRL